MSKINVRSFSNENEDGAPDLVGISTFQLGEPQKRDHQGM